MQGIQSLVGPSAAKWTDRQQVAGPSLVCPCKVCRWFKGTLDGRAPKRSKPQDLCLAPAQPWRQHFHLHWRSRWMLSPRHLRRNPRQNPLPVNGPRSGAKAALHEFLGWCNLQGSYIRKSKKSPLQATSIRSLASIREHAWHPIEFVLVKKLAVFLAPSIIPCALISFLPF